MRHRRAISGVLLALMVVVAAWVGLNPDVASYKDIWPSGVFAFAAALLLLPDTNSAQRFQLGVLVLAGIALLFFGLAKGATINWSGILSQNTGLLSMLMSVGLLKLIITRHSANPRLTKPAAIQKLPVGRKAYWHTLVSVTVFGSVINISAPILISDRLTLNRPMDYFTAATVVRAFSACACWSPFFAGMAVVLTAVGDVNLLSVMAFGFPLTVASVVVLYVSAIWFHPEKLKTFHGYPIRKESLLVPFLLSGMVFLSNLIFPHVAILTIISLASIALTISLLLIRHGFASTARSMRDYVRIDLAKTVNEVQLFISAGILASGLQAMVQVGSIGVPIQAFTGVSACILLALIIVIAAMGIHPVIQIAAMTPLILAANPDPELLGLTYLFGWSLGTCGSPLSGTNLVMQGRYGIIAWRGAVQNWPYIFFMYGIAALLLLFRGWAG